MNFSTTWLSIANAALSMINRQVLQSLDDSSTSALLCNQFIPIVAKDILSQNDWKSARRYTALAPIQESQGPSGYPYAYQLPADFIRVCSIEGSWQRAGDRIYSDQPELHMLYIAMPANPTAIDAPIVSAIVAMLAARLAYALTSDYSLVSSYISEANARIAAAKLIEQAGELDDMPPLNDIASEADVL